MRNDDVVDDQGAEDERNDGNAHEKDKHGGMRTPDAPRVRKKRGES